MDTGNASDIDRRTTVYEELCTSYRAIDDFRAKLLAFLPFASGTGIFLLIRPVDGDFPGATKTILWAVGTFGFLVTLGLFSYELYGIKKCHALIRAGRELERDLGISAQRGQFGARPREVAELINEPFAAGVIYPAVLAAWVFLALVEAELPNAQWWAIGLAIGVFVIGFAVVLYYNLKLGMEDGIRLVLGIEDEDPVTLRHLGEYFTSEEVEKKIRKKFKMGTEDSVGIRHKRKYLREVNIGDVHGREMMRGERVSADTRGQVIKALIDYLNKDDQTTLDDVLKDYPTVSREYAVAYLEVALRDIK